MYAAFDLPESKRALFFKHMGHSGQINEDIYQAPLAIQEVTHVGSVLHHIDTGKEIVLLFIHYLCLCLLQSGIR